MSSLSGLPPLPKSLSGLLDLNNHDKLDSSASSSFQLYSNVVHPPPPPPAPSSHRAPHLPTAHGSFYANVPQAAPPVAPVPRPRPGSRGSVGSLNNDQDLQDDSGRSRRSSTSSGHTKAHTDHRKKLVSPSLVSGEVNPSPLGPRKFSGLDSQLGFLRKEIVGLRQMDMDLLVQLWSLNESIQEYKTVVEERQSRHSSMSPHSWMEQEGDTDGESDEYYSGADYGDEPTYTQPYRNGLSSSSNTVNNRLKPVPEHQYQTGSSSSVEYGDI